MVEGNFGLKDRLQASDPIYLLAKPQVSLQSDLALELASLKLVSTGSVKPNDLELESLRLQACLG